MGLETEEPAFETFEMNCENLQADVDHLQAQARGWLEAVLEETFPDGQPLPDALADGFLLVRVAGVVERALQEEREGGEGGSTKSGTGKLPTPRGPSTKAGSFFIACVNVERFLKACREAGLKDVNLFTPSDLLERKDLRRVYLCLRALSKRVPYLVDFDSIMTPKRRWSGEGGGERSVGGSSGASRGSSKQKDSLRRQEPDRASAGPVVHSLPKSKSSYPPPPQTDPNLPRSSSAPSPLPLPPTTMPPPSNPSPRTPNPPAPSHQGSSASPAPNQNLRPRLRPRPGARPDSEARDRDPESGSEMDSFSEVSTSTSIRPPSLRSAIVSLHRGPPSPSRVPSWVAHHASLATLRPISPGGGFSELSPNRLRSDSENESLYSAGGGNLSRMDSLGSDFVSAAQFHQSSQKDNLAPKNRSWDLLTVGAAAALIGGAIVLANRASSSSPYVDRREIYVPMDEDERDACEKRPHLGMGKDGTFELHWNTCLSSSGEKPTLIISEDEGTTLGSGPSGDATGKSSPRPWSDSTSSSRQAAASSPSPRSGFETLKSQRNGLSPIRTRVQDLSYCEKYSDLCKGSTPLATDKLTHVKPNVKVYEVQNGDTLASIAKYAGRSWQEIADKNPHIKNPNVIYPKDRLML